MTSISMTWNVRDLVTLAEYLGSRWFNKGNMKFFSTRLTSHFKRVDDSTAYFVTTEKGPDGTRKASIRKAVLSFNEETRRSNLTIDTVRQYQEYTSIQTAKRHMEKL